jgi:hypothetical protein
MMIIVIITDILVLEVHQIVQSTTCKSQYSVGVLVTQTYIYRSLDTNIYICVKTNKFSNYSFSLLIMYGSSYMFRYYIAIVRERS